MAKIAQVPVPLVIVTVALVTPLVVLCAPSEQTDVLVESTDNTTANPDVDSAATGNMLPYPALAGAVVVNVIVWLIWPACAWASSKAPMSQAEPCGRAIPR
jgi:hypothetical protein